MYTLANMQDSIKKVEATRAQRMATEPRRMTADEKDALLAAYHPDYKEEGFITLKVGPNKGEKVPTELGYLLESNSRILGVDIDLDKVDYDVDVLVIGAGGAGSSAAIEAHEAGANVMITTKLRIGDANTMMAEGGIQAADKENDSPAQHYLDAFGGGHFAARPELLRKLVMEAPDAISWLEEFLINFENTVIVVSHDRYFLNKVCTHIADIDYAKIQLFSGNYDFWYESSQLLTKQMKEANKKKEEKMKELQDFIARFSANASKSKQATSRKKALDKIQLDELKPSSRKYPYINFKPNREIGNDALVVENLTKTIDGVKVLDNISFLMKPTDKIAFVGPNTLAATTLFKILSGEMEPDSGSYKWGVTTTQSYFPKDNTKDFSQDETIVEWLTQYSEDKDATFVRGFLGRMLFSGEDALKKVGVLSGGEKVRCMLSKLMISGANILLLDEPTNHLDMESITALNEALKDFTGALLFTSQDHQFVQTTANRIMEITPNGLIDKECTYDEYLENDEAARKRQIVEIEEDDE